MVEYIHAETEKEYAEAATLFKEYADWLNIDLSFQHFSEELRQLKTMYGPPYGSIILCRIENEYTGCIAIRKFDEKIAELKRMFVRPAYRKEGIGSELLKRSISQAKKYGYIKIRLDTLSTMTPAMNLYKRYGFYEIPAYYFNPEKNAVYFEKILAVNE